MINSTPFIAGAGLLPESKMFKASLALSKAWGRRLIEFHRKDDPNKILGQLSNDGRLALLTGDPAVLNSFGQTWLEALGAWRNPTILIVSPLESGEIPGTAAAYAALCKTLSVPLIGIIQLGGSWEDHPRRLDNLPWCGLIPDQENRVNKQTETFYKKEDQNLEVTALRLWHQLKNL